MSVLSFSRSEFLGRNKSLNDYYVKQAVLTDFITVEILKTVAQPVLY